MCELRTTGAFANGPYAGRRGLQAFINTDEAACIDLDTSFSKTDVGRVGDTSDGNQQVNYFGQAGQ